MDDDVQVDNSQIIENNESGSQPQNVLDEINQLTEKSLEQSKDESAEQNSGKNKKKDPVDSEGENEEGNVPQENDNEKPNDLVKHLRNTITEQRKEKDLQINELSSELESLKKVIDKDKPELELDQAISTFLKVKNGEINNISEQQIRSEISKHSVSELNDIIEQAAMGNYGDDSDEILDIASRFKPAIQIAETKRNSRVEEFNSLNTTVESAAKVRAASFKKVVDVIPSLDLENPTDVDSQGFVEEALAMQRENPSLFNNPVSPELILNRWQSKKLTEVVAQKQKRIDELEGKLNLNSNPQSGQLSNNTSLKNSTSAYDNFKAEIAALTG